MDHGVFQLGLRQVPAGGKTQAEVAVHRFPGPFTLLVAGADTNVRAGLAQLDRYGRQFALKAKLVEAVKGLLEKV